MLRVPVLVRSDHRRPEKRVQRESQNRQFAAGVILCRNSHRHRTRHYSARP
ncbi:hypothetical protein EPIB1_595 [Tritonibacter mobilis]|nr:hypothetical protein EPIB1_595 [Tritonibacter mobilis]